MQTKFMVSGSAVYIYNLNEETTLDVLPPKVYTIKYNQLDGFYLSITKSKLEIPAKIYGNTRERVEKCIATYKTRNTSTGILLTGDKGTGKTLLMSLLANEVMDRLSLPVLLVTEPYNGTQFTSFIASIGECCMIFDEFGKMYTANGRNENDVPQKSLLSLMDGVDKTKRLIILTENSELDISEFMLNRPSRIYYHFRYKKLDESSIEGYCEDLNINTSITKDIIDLSRRSKIFSFDMLQSIVEEHLRFGNPISEIVQDLNIDTRENFLDTYEIIKVVDKATGKQKELFDSPFVSKPDRYSYIKLKRTRSNPDSESEFEEAYEEFSISVADFAYQKDNMVVYENEKYTVVMKTPDIFVKNYSNLF